MDRKIGVYVEYDPAKEMWHPMPAEKCLVMDGEGLVHDSFVYGGQIGGYWFGLMDSSPAHLDQNIYRLAPLKKRQDWEDMKPSECDKENGDHDEWIPEAGQECDYSFKMFEDESMTIRVKFIGMDGQWAVIKIPNQNKKYSSTTLTCLRPIQSKADKERDKQMTEINRSLESCGVYRPELDVVLYDKGVRVLQPGEAIGRRLSGEEVVNLMTENHILCEPKIYNFIDDLQRAIFGESDDE